MIVSIKGGILRFFGKIVGTFVLALCASERERLPELSRLEPNTIEPT